MAFKRKTVFVVGAGASAEVGLPVGTKLAQQISDRLSIEISDEGRLTGGDGELWKTIQMSRRGEAGAYLEAAKLIRHGVVLANSIDDFLDVHKADARAVELGKAAIVRSILVAERQSKLFYDRSNIYNKLSFSKAEGTWLIKLMRMLGRGITPENAHTIFDNVAFVVFNYDRVIEHFLFTALKQFYNVDETRAAELMQTLSIVHPYGMVGSAPYGNNGGIAYGGGLRAVDGAYMNLAQRIRTYAEQSSDEVALNAIKQKIEEAEKIVFLGFAFHDQNVELLRPRVPLTERKQIFGTAFGMSANDVGVVKSQLQTFFGNGSFAMRMRDRMLLEQEHKCGDVFDYYAKSLPA
jgi:hypothetical protein